MSSISIEELDIAVKSASSELSNAENDLEKEIIGTLEYNMAEISATAWETILSNLFVLKGIRTTRTLLSELKEGMEFLKEDLHPT